MRYLVAAIFMALPFFGYASAPSDAITAYMKAMSDGNPHTVYKMFAKEFRGDRKAFIDKFMEYPTSPKFRAFIFENSEMTVLNESVDDDVAVVHYQYSFPDTHSAIVNENIDLALPSDWDAFADKMSSDGFKRITAEYEQMLFLEDGEWRLIPPDDIRPD